MSRPARFPVIVGPTAGGKSDLALAAARHFAAAGTPAEIVSADSVQIFRGMDIGSAKPTAAQRAAVPHHLVDVVEPTESFTVHDWLRAAERAVAEIRARGSVPIVVGGTHLYVRAFLQGLFTGPPARPELRRQLSARGQESLRAELEHVDPDAAARIHRRDHRRTVRALEVFYLTGIPLSRWQVQWGRPPRDDCVLVMLDWPPAILNRRINARVRGMVEAGLVEEVRRLHQAGRLGPQAREALGYRQILAWVRGECTLDQAIEQIKIETRRLARQQRTWLRRLRTVAPAVRIAAAEVPPDQWPQIVVHACAAKT